MLSLLILFILERISFKACVSKMPELSEENCFLKLTSMLISCQRPSCKDSGIE